MAEKAAPKEVEQAIVQFDAFEKQLRSLSNQPLGQAPETEAQTKLSSREANREDLPYIKPSRTIASSEKFNDKYKAQFEYAKQYVRVIAENNEIIGEAIEVWTKPFPGVAAEFWKVPVNRPIMIPRYVASQISTRQYVQYSMTEPKMTGTEGGHQFYSGMIGKDIKRRLDCRPTAPVTVSMFS